MGDCCRYKSKLLVLFEGLSLKFSISNLLLFAKQPGFTDYGILLALKGVSLE